MTKLQRETEWLKIKATPRGKRFFFYKGNRIFVASIMECRSAWIGGLLPSFIKGIEVTDVSNPMFVETNRKGNAVRIWKLA